MGTFYSRKYSLISLLQILLIGACSTVQKLDEAPRVIQEPYYKTVGEAQLGFQFRDSDTDYKIRKIGHEKPILAFSPIAYPNSIDKKLASYFEQELGLVWKNTEFTNAKIPSGAWENSQTLLVAAKKSEVDALVRGSVSETEFGWLFKFTIVDPVNDYKFGEFEASFKRPGSTSDEVGTWSQVFFWKTGDRIISLDPRKATVPVWDKKPDSSIVRDLAYSSVKGKISIQASSGDTEVHSKGILLGKTPLLDISLPEGVQEIQLSLKGKKPISKTIVVRAGKKSFLFQEWEEDKTLGSAKIVSVPAGLSVSVDGFKQGETPFFHSGMNPGGYQIELIKENPEGSLVYYEGTLEVKSDKVSELAFPYSASGLLSETEFWKPSGETGFNPFGALGIEFHKSKDLSPGWNGVYSLPIPSDELEITGYFLLPVDHKVGSVAVTIHTPGLNLGLNAGPDKVSIFNFPSDGKTIATYKYLKLENDIGRKFSFRTNTKEKKIFLYLGNDLVWEGQVSFQGFWTISVLTRGEDFRERAPLKDLKIQYRGYK